MAIELDEFFKELQQEVYASADADGRFVEDTFFDVFCGHLIDAGELDTAERAHYQPPTRPFQQGMRIDGYGGDPVTSGGVLSLIVLEYTQSGGIHTSVASATDQSGTSLSTAKLQIQTLTATAMEAAFKRAANFLRKCFDPSFRNGLEETSPAFGLADLIANRWPSVQKVRLILITDMLLSAKVDGREAGEIEGAPLTYSVWDLARLFRFVTSGRGREEIVIDMADFGGPILALPAHLTVTDYEAYLAVVSGRQVADIYDKWGARLLEQNVRVFLQARGNVNKGIRNTIEGEPGMFFAYNNGITATAESVESDTVDGQLRITGFRNLQIVNGGQTTASIHAASKKKDIDLSNVFVQMKLSIIDPARSEEVVPRISEYANSQNRVSAADFFSNHPFHLRMSEFSRRIFAPSPDGVFRESKWFYERARGQYQDARSRLSTAQRGKFDLEYPKRQVITKTDLAKFLNAWSGFPHVVSKGAQKNFAHFASAIGKEWIKQSDAYNEFFFRQVIVKAIIFRDVERLVTKQPWYQGGYRANFVAYTVSKLASEVEQGGLSFDYDTVWKSQAVSDYLNRGLLLVAEAVQHVIMEPPPGMRNISEWAKTEACGSRAASIKIPWPDGLVDKLRAIDTLRDVQKAAVKDQRMLNGIQAQMSIVKAGAAVWREVKDWGVGRKLLTQTEADLLDVASSIPARMPSDKQSVLIIETLLRLHREGCRIGLDIV